MKTKYMLSMLIIMTVMIIHPLSAKAAEAEYKPNIDPKNFSTDINNKYFNLPIGRQFVYEEVTDEGVETVDISIPGDTKEIMGVKTLLYRDTVKLDGVLVEDTKDYLAQDKEGNVWYFGEEVNNYEDGKLINHKGSWIAGVNGAFPGIWIKANPKVGDSYRQEYLKGEAEDMSDVLALNEKVSIKYGNFNDCVKVYDWTPLDPESKEHKYYCSEVGGLVKSENLVKKETSTLISASKINDSKKPADAKNATTPTKEESKKPAGVAENSPNLILISGILGAVFLLGGLLVLLRKK